MNGHVDNAGRALLPIRIANARDTPHTEVLAWIDTAFDGHLVLPVGLIEALELDSLAQAEGILADGSIVTLETCFCFVEWFGKRVPLQVIANDGRFPLHCHLLYVAANGRAKRSCHPPSIHSSKSKNKIQSKRRRWVQRFAIYPCPDTNRVARCECSDSVYPQASAWGLNAQYLQDRE